MKKTILTLLPVVKSLKQAITAFRLLPVACAGNYNSNVLIASVRTYNRTSKLSAKLPSSPAVTFDNEDTYFKEQLVSSLNFKNTEEALPFYKLPVKTLVHLSKVTKHDEKKGYCKNRVYYIAQRLKVEPLEISERIAKRTFLYTLSFDWLKNSFDVLLEMGVSPERILRDLWVLKYHHLTIKERLQKIKDMGIDTLCPWMVRCSEDILKRFITISQETKTILGDTKSTQIYLANRLNISPETVDDMYCRLPALRVIRVTKLKNFLDFLLNEGFTAEDITRKVRILTTSQKTVEQRLEKLRKLGVKQINLNVLCRTRRHFSKYCQSIESGASSQF